MNPNNFVNIVGYQLEKVHTGVIKYIFEDSNIDIESKYTIIKKMFNFSNCEIDFYYEDISYIKCFPEYSFGRNTRVDLVIKIKLKDESEKFLVIEMKVHSIPYEEQFERTYKKCEECFKDNARYFLFVLGSSQVSLIPRKTHNFKVCMLNEIINIFEGILSLKNNFIYNSWLESLDEEIQRKNEIVNHLRNTSDLYDDYFWDRSYWNSLGYRTWFPLLYYIYNELRKEFDKDKTWNIYSGNNNPVMNWEEGWIFKNINGYDIEFYWEFNYEKLLLKIFNKEKKMPKDELFILKRELFEICKEVTKNCDKTQNREGIYISVCKWEFNFRKDSIKDIAESTNKIINEIHCKLKDFNYSVST